MTDSWPRTSLAKVTTKIGSGATPRGGKEVYGDKGVAFIRSQNVYDNIFSMDGLARISDDAAKALEGVTVQSGDVLINITGESVTRTCLVDERVLPARVSQHVAIVRPDPSILDSGFLKAALLAPAAKARLNALSSAGATRRALTKAHLGAFEIPLPPLHEQRRIAAVLGVFDNLIEINRALTSALDSLFHAEWQRRYLALQESAASLTLSDLCDTQYGYTESATKEDSGPRFLRVADINKNNWIDWASVPFCPISPDAHGRYQLRRDDLVVARMADPGKAAIIDDEVDAVFASYLVRLIPKRPHMAQFLYGLLKSPYYAEYAAGAMTGSVQKNMNARVITGCRVELPSDQSLREFDALGRVLRSMIGEFVREKTELTRTRDELLPLLLSGRVLVEAAAV